MIKLKTGVSTSLDFVKAMKERGQDVSPAFPAETLRDQLDTLSDDVKVTFNSDNETILQVVNDYEPGPTPTEKVTLTLDFNGGRLVDGADIKNSVEIELDKGSEYTPTDPTLDPNFIGKEGYAYDGWSTVKDSTSMKITGSIVVSQDMTIYVLWERVEPVLEPWDGKNPAAVKTIYFRDNYSIDPTSETYLTFKDALGNYGPYNAAMFDVDSFGEIKAFATSTTTQINIEFRRGIDPNYTVLASWEETAPGVFTRTSVEPDSESSPEAGGITFVGEDGSILKATDIFLGLIGIKEE